MKHSIIKDFKGWNRLIESTQYMREAADPNTPIETLLQQTDLEGLYQRILTSDDANTKALPNYAAIIEWWHQGGPDLNLWKTIFKAGGEAKRDKQNSAKSMYYWLGGFAKQGTAATSASQYNYVKNVEDFCTAIKQFAPSISASVAKFTKPAEQKRYEGWKDAAQKADAVLALIAQVKAKGLNLSQQSARLLIPAVAVDGSFTISQQRVPFATYFKEVDDAFKKGSDDGITTNSYAFSSGNWQIGGNTTPLQTIQQNVQTLTSAMGDQTKLSQYFSANNTLGFEEKKTIADYINQRVQKYVDRKNSNPKPGQAQVDAATAIKTATDLYIVPAGTSLTLPPETIQPSPEPIIINGSYPENPNGDWASAAMNKAKQFFGDDKIQIEAPALQEMTTGIKTYLDQIKADGAQITGVKISGISSTSRVPSSYDPGSKTANPASGYTEAHNVPLAQDRLASIKAAMKQVFAQNGVADNLITEDTASDVVNANAGDAWTDADKTKFANRKQPGQEALMKEYEDKFGKYKYAFARFEITYTLLKPVQKTFQADPIPNSKWKVFISWRDETWQPPKIDIPHIGIGPGPSKPPKTKGNPMQCPVF